MAEYREGECDVMNLWTVKMGHSGALTGFGVSALRAKDEDKLKSLHSAHHSLAAGQLLQFWKAVNFGQRLLPSRTALNTLSKDWLF